MSIQAWERGGPNDPRVVFDSLRASLTVVKEELSPWGWRAFSDEFRDRQKAEKRLQALNGLPGSGAEPSDGVVQGTPLWQERLDKILLVEHLKKRLMTAHGYFVESSELLLKSHAWLVKEAGFADEFVVAITHVPPATSERLDLLQNALMKTKKDNEILRNAFEDFKIDLRKKRVVYCNKVSDNQDIALRRRLLDDTVVSWSFQAQRSTSLRLGQVRRVLESRVLSLETSFATRTEELEESQRQWDEEKEALTADRDKFKKLYNRMVKAHEQAMEDLKQSRGSAEDMAKMIQVLSTEKHMLTERVKELEDDKRRMEKMIADLRDEVALLKKEIRRYGALLRSGEFALVDARADAARAEEVGRQLWEHLRDAASVEAALRDELAAEQCASEAARARLPPLREEIAAEVRLRRTVEAERDRLLDSQRTLERTVTRCMEDAYETLEAVMERARAELEQFKTSELQKVKDDFRKKTEALIRRNAQLEKEVAIGDAVAPHLAVLNPLDVDNSRLCASCRKAFVFDGILEQPEDERPHKR